MWHASVRAATTAAAEAMAERALQGVGDARLGEWRAAHIAFHIRRRLSDAEVERYKLHMVDLRGTTEGRDRMKSLLLSHPQLKPLAIGIGEYADI